MKILKIGDSLIFGVQHYNMDDVEKVSNYVKKNFNPNDKIVFMGEGGDDDNIYEKGGEQEAIQNELQTYFTNFINDSWDGKETNVTNPKSSLFKEMQSETSLSSNKIMAAIYVIIVGQTSYPQEMSHLLNDEGIEWIKSFGIKNPKTPDEEDIELMYNLCFPQDTGKPETELSKLTDIFNYIRDKNLVTKIKNYRKKGYRVIATVGEGHIELIKNNFDNKEKDLDEKWSKKYKDSIDCNNPKGFSQRAHCQGKKKKMNETEILKGGLADNKTLVQIAKKHDAKNYYHIDDMVKSLKKQLEMGMKVEMEHTDSKEKAHEIAMDHLWEDPSYYTKLKKIEAKETDSSSSGAYSAPLFGKSSTVKRKISHIPNMDLNEEEEVEEATTSSSSGAFDVPAFGKTTKGGRKNPLKIDGPSSEYQGRAVKDKNFPKWGGPDSVFVKVKEKCKKFPYCNQGNTGAIEFIKEDQEIQEAITHVSKKYGISHQEVENIVLNEIKQIFI